MGQGVDCNMLAERLERCLPDLWLGKQLLAPLQSKTRAMRFVSSAFTGHFLCESCAERRFLSRPGKSYVVFYSYPNNNYENCSNV